MYDQAQETAKDIAALDERIANGEKYMTVKTVIVKNLLAALVQHPHILVSTCDGCEEIQNAINELGKVGV